MKDPETGRVKTFTDADIEEMKRRQSIRDEFRDSRDAFLRLAERLTADDVLAVFGSIQDRQLAAELHGALMRFRRAEAAKNELDREPK